MDKSMTHTPDITRPPKEWVEALKEIGAATASSTLGHMGVRSPFMVGPVARSPGKVVAGPALTLQCMPKREDLFSEEEYARPGDRSSTATCSTTPRPGDVVVVDARGDLRSGIFGDMMLTYFNGKGGVGVVIDGCIRDYPKVQRLDLGLWLNGVTPNYHAQTDIVPVRRQRAGRLRRRASSCRATSSSPTTTASWWCRWRWPRRSSRRRPSTTSGRSSRASGCSRAATCAATIRSMPTPSPNTRSGCGRRARRSCRASAAAGAQLHVRSQLVFVVPPVGGLPDAGRAVLQVLARSPRRRCRRCRGRACRAPR